MKALWNGIALLLLINFVALVAFAVWLHQTDRLNGQRVRSAVEAFELTVAQEKEQEEESQRLTEENQQVQKELDWKESVKAGPSSVGDRLDAIQEAKEQQLQAELRWEKDREALLDVMKNLQRRVDAKQKKLDAEIEEFQKREEARARRYKSENFGKAVQMYEQSKPKQVKSMFLNLIAQGQQNQVIEYLAAMQPRKAAAVLKQFKDDAEIGVAAGLIEGLRTRGVGLLTQDTTDQNQGVDG